MFSIDKTKCVNCGNCAVSCPMGIFRMEDGVATVGAEKRCIRCFHCSAACPAKAVVYEGMSRESLYPTFGGTHLEGLVVRRRSVRHFKENPPPRSLLERAIQVAAYAPSAKNQCLCRWTVLYGKERTDTAVKRALDWAVENKVDPALTAMARSGRNLVTCGAPCVVVCHAPKAAAAMPDGGITTATLELLFNEAGLGTCWAGYFARLADAAPPLRAFLGLAEEEQVLCALMVGESDGDHYLNLPPRCVNQINWID